MQLKPNKTVFAGEISDLRPEDDGWGTNIDVIIAENYSVNDDNDFIQPKKGDILTLFSTDASNLQVGDKVKVNAILLGGPTGSRNVAETIQRL